MNKIDAYLETIPSWQKEFLILFRQAIHEEIADIEEDWKWNVPVFLLNGKLLFAMSGFKAHTKYNFIGNGALIEDPHHLFNNGFESKKSRGIDLKEGDKINVSQLRALIKLAADKIS
jgi:hypothetical protein